jgi:hypothetical protein
MTGTLEANPYSGFGNVELRYSYNLTSSAFDHSLVAGAVFPTESNGVESIDAQLKFFYTAKWKWSQRRLTLPNVSFVDSPAWLFNSGGLYQSAAGGIITGNVNDIAFNIIDSWGIGRYGLWKYRFEASAAARL